MTTQGQTQRKVVYYVAVSIDQYIAHEDETIDGFLMQGQHALDYLNDLQNYDTVVMGRGTYEWGYQFGLKAGESVPTYAHMAQYVFSKTLADSHDPQLQVIRDDPAETVRGLKAQEGKPIYLCGGGEFAGYLLAQGLVDEVILKVNPVFFGGGIPLFGETLRTINLSLLDTKIYNNGVVFLHYAIC